MLVVASRFVRDMTLIRCDLATVNPVILVFLCHWYNVINKGYIVIGVFAAFLVLALVFGCFRGR